MLPTPAPLIGDEPDRSHPLMDRLAVWYPFSEGGGTTAFDVGPRKNNGTLTSMAAATDWVIGPHGKALDLDATNDYVLIDGGNYVADHNLPLTVCWRERITSNTGAAFISRFRIANTNTSVNRSFLVLRTSHVDYQPVCWGGSNTTSTAAGTNFRSLDVPSIADSVGVWNHFVLVCHGGVASQVAGDYSLYLNGRPVSVTSARGMNVANSSSRFGYDAVDAGSNCRMADVRLYARGLGNSDVADIYSDPWAPFARRKVYGFAPAGGGGFGAYLAAASRSSRTLCGSRL